MMHQSISTIDSPEFINLQPLELNPLMSSCEIKVLYLGENRNHSYITKEVATEMAKTLRGAPIVGYYREDKEDFRDHGEKVILDDEGIKFECLTKPYGFVAPDAQVWFQKFEDTDEFGNKEVREYLMTTGYLWTGQYEEAKLAVDEGRPQSMELDSETLDGHWATNNKTGMDFFIINDAIFSKLCILGEDVEPCFEGARITAPEVSKTFSKMDDSFKTTLFTMMKDLKSVLKGGYQMELEDKETLPVEPENDNVEETPVVEEEVVETTEEVVEEPEVETPEEEEIPAEENTEESEETAEVIATEEYTALQKELTELKDKFSKLEEDYNALVSFKEAVDNEKKDALINSFYMLSDEDKKDVIENKAKYSLDEIEAKLSVICVRKKVNFEKEDNEKNENKLEDPVTTFSLEDDNASTPAWLASLKKHKEENENK